MLVASVKAVMLEKAHNDCNSPLSFSRKGLLELLAELSGGFAAENSSIGMEAAAKIWLSVLSIHYKTSRLDTR